MNTRADNARTNIARTEDDLDRRLKAAAVPVRRGRALQAPAQALAERIVATPRVADATDHSAAPVAAARPHGGRRHRRLVAAALGGGAATALAVGLMLAPGPSSQAAYASWKATADPLPAADLHAIASRCVADSRQRFHDPAARLDDAQQVLGEQRGAYEYVYVAMPKWSVTCFRDREGQLHQTSEFAASATVDELGRRGVELNGWAGLRTNEGRCRLMVGHLGSDVVAVDIATSDGWTLQATVSGGHFLAWYPETDPDSSSPTTLTLHLRDGGRVTGLSARDLMEEPYLG